MPTVGAVQLNVSSGQKSVNLERGMKLVEQAVREGAQLVVLPELWSTGYYLSLEAFHEVAETQDGPTLARFRDLARKLQVVLVVPFAEKADEYLYITAAVIESTGEIAGWHRKSFVWGREKDIFTPGERRYSPIPTSVGRLGVLICYDIEFPEPARILALQGADLLVVPSVWSIGAETRWDIQLAARALDNTVFVLGVNTIGEGSCGKTKLVAPDGQILYEAPRDKEDVVVQELDYSVVSEVRTRIPYLADFDRRLSPGATR